MSSHFTRLDQPLYLFIPFRLLQFPCTSLRTSVSFVFAHFTAAIRQGKRCCHSPGEVKGQQSPRPAHDTETHLIYASRPKTQAYPSQPGDTFEYSPASMPSNVLSTNDEYIANEQSRGLDLDYPPSMSEYHNELPPTTVAPSSTSPAPGEPKTADSTSKHSTPDPLDASDDARKIVRLAQCTLCSLPLRDPITLPCGNSLCRPCVPALHSRSNISYPGTESRSQGFTCPFVECGIEHSAADCSLDVTLSKVLGLVKADIEQCRPEVGDTPMLLQESDDPDVAGLSGLSNNKPRSRILHGGRLVATYTMAAMGELRHGAEVSYTTLSDRADDSRYLDVAVLEHLKETTRSELDCQVCYALFLDPLTTSCGHTFCRKCLHRVLDHSNCCPICRRALAIPPAISIGAYPFNKTLVSLLTGLCPDALAARADAIRQEEISRMGELDTPLFLCTLAFPSMPTFLHIFEPRYRLMIRRAMESGERRFGMLLPNRHQTPQGELGNVPFFQYGTMLHIISMQLLADGRSLIETIGMHRFKVIKHGVLDGYVVGKIERVDDISLADEEALEASETSRPQIPRPPSAADHFGASPHHFPAGLATGTGRRPSTVLDLERTSTIDLMDIATRFVTTMKAVSAPWLQRRVLQIHGECPNDPSAFPWWFASIVPVTEAEKYKLFSTTSVRERLKICVSWILRIEAQRWPNPHFPRSNHTVPSVSNAG